MSEYQYYEFLAIDRPLTESEMRELRAISSRAEITPTSFSNEYNYGDLRGNAEDLLAQYFDAFVYVANWGTRRFAMRVPCDAADWDEIAPYCAGMNVSARRTDDHIVVDLMNDPEDWDAGWTEGEGWMASLAGVRQEFLGGDMRCLYLAWLLYPGGYEGEDDVPDTPEPPVPPGLTALPEPLQALVEFLQIDEDSIAVAGEGSAPAPPEQEGLAAWIAQLPAAEKDAFLLRAAQGDHAGAAAALNRGFRATREPAGDPERPRRTVGELNERIEELREARKQERLRLAAEERLRRKAAEAAAKEKRLDTLSPRKVAAWVDVEQLVAARQQDSYDDAIRLLVDLRDLAEREGDEWGFGERLGVLLEVHVRKTTFVAKVEKAGLLTTV
ncbi:hypothetical protein CMK11_19960 [Candidatus Poribacteria bacterium]|nr:hypothetical protein [Candidatus Poribacteria bacterium]